MIALLQALVAFIVALVFGVRDPGPIDGPIVSPPPPIICVQEGCGEIPPSECTAHEVETSPGVWMLVTDCFVQF